jgi:hypothetical protein
MQVVPASLAEPTTAAVARRPGSIRRTSHVDMLFPPGGDLVLRGAARDLLTPPEGEPSVAAAATVEAHLDAERRLVGLTCDPPAPFAERLLGLVVAKGFRAALAEAAGAGGSPLDRRSPLVLLLDDLPVTALISGYARLYDGEIGSRSEDGRRTAMVRADICSGWRSDGTMMVELRNNRDFPTPVGPPAPDLSGGDPWAWHPIEPLAPSSMRRRRLVDITRGDPLAVSAMFRDSHTDSAGNETVLHEYTIEALVDRASLVVARCRATPRTLPWRECPAAAASASRLEGQAVAGLREFVRDELTGITTCTHLNDLCRSLADVGVLAEGLGAL